MLDKLKQLMEMKKQAEEIKRQLENTRIEINDGRGVKIIINGAQHFESVEISDDMVKSQDKRRMEAELLRGINGAIAKSQAAAAQKMKDVTGFNIPGF